MLNQQQCQQPNIKSARVTDINQATELKMFTCVVNISFDLKR